MCESLQSQIRIIAEEYVIRFMIRTDHFLMLKSPDLARVRVLYLGEFDIG